MNLTKQTKNQFKNDESIQSQIVGQTVLEQYALKVFDKADDEDRRAIFSKYSIEFVDLYSILIQLKMTFIIIKEIQ